MLSTVRQYTPENWTTASSSEVSSSSEEYQQVTYEIRRAFGDQTSPRIRRLVRVQDLHSYGQFLIREQLLLNANVHQELFRVRRFSQVSNAYSSAVMTYNLDPRRCGLEQPLTLGKTIRSSSFNKLIVVVKVLTTNHASEHITPATSCDYYVEYVVEVEN